MSSDATPARQRLSVGLKAGWGIGAIGAVTMLTLVNVLLMYFMVNYLNIDPAVAGTVVFATRLYDTVFDPAMGWLSDRVRTRWGRRRPWMALAAVISTVTCLAAFNPPSLEPGTALPAYMLLILVLYFSGYTMFYIPYMAMPAEMTTDPDERTSIMSYRTFFSGAGGMMATAVAPALVSALGRTREAYAQTGAILAAVIGLCMMTAALSTGGARHTQPSPTRTPWREWVASIFSNRPLVALLSAKLLIYFEISVVAGFGLFFMTSAVGRGEKGQALLGAIMNGITLLILPLLVRFVKGKPKKRMLTLAVAIHGLATLSWIFATPEEADAIFILRCVGIGIGYAAIVLMVLSMMPDVIAYDFERTGLRREGVLSSLFAFVEKLAYALTPLVTGFLLKAVGYVQGKGGTLAQPDAAIWGVRLGTSVLPAVLALAGIVCLRFYHLEPAARPTMEEAP